MWFEESPIASFYQRAYTEPLRLPDGALLYPTYCSRGQTRHLHFLLSDSFGVGQSLSAFVSGLTVACAGSAQVASTRVKASWSALSSGAMTRERRGGSAPPSSGRTVRGNRPLACCLAPAEKVSKSRSKGWEQQGLLGRRA